MKYYSMAIKLNIFIKDFNLKYFSIFIIEGLPGVCNFLFNPIDKNV